MCRSIKLLRTEEDVAEREEIRAAALQFVRKITGTRSSSVAGSTAFESAVNRIAAAAESLLAEMGPKKVGVPANP